MVEENGYVYADDHAPVLKIISADLQENWLADVHFNDGNLYEAINNASKSGKVTMEEIEEKIEAMAIDAMKSGNILVNPRTSKQKDIENLYKAALL